jgi:plasmid stabilization system protein ParE
MVEIVVSSAAELEYAEALRWYTERSVQAAERFEAEFGSALDAIAADPNRFPMCDARHRYLLMDHYPFQIVFREFGSGIAIVAVAHAKRRPGYWEHR